MIHAIAPRKKPPPVREFIVTTRAASDPHLSLEDLNAIEQAPPQSPPHDQMVELEGGTLTRSSMKFSSRMNKHGTIDRTSQIYSSSPGTSAAGSNRVVNESIFSLTDNEMSGGYLSSNPCSVHLTQEGARPMHYVHRAPIQSVQVIKT